MNDKELQIVSFEQAQRLKALGFDWKCHDCWHETEPSKMNPKGLPLLSYRLDTSNPNYYNNSFSAPSVALALKWMRDAKNLIGTVGRNSGGYFFSIEQNGKWMGIVDGWHYGDVEWKIYEVVESELLDELIDIIENENK
jgi:hypothetical protein